MIESIQSASGRPFDAIVVGSGAGGSAAASGLAEAGLEVLIVEKGDRLERDGSTLDVQRVVVNGEFKSREPWVDGSGREVVPEEYFNLGGKTKWYGAALLRFAPDEFQDDQDHQCPSWPIGYADLAPYYRQAEDALGLHTFDPEPDLAGLIAAMLKINDRWAVEPLHMGLNPEIVHHPHEARHFDGFASTLGLKADAEVAFLSRLERRRNVKIVTGTPVASLLGRSDQPGTIIGVRLKDGRIATGRSVLLAAGALHSPLLLQQYLDRHGLGGLPMAANVGRNLKLHLLTAVLAIGTRRQRDLLRKTALLLNQEVPHSSIQPLGFDGELLANLIPRYVPRGVARVVGAHAYGFFLQTEDGSHPENRVLPPGGVGNPSPTARIDYDPRRLGTARLEHARLCSLFRRTLLKAGYLNFARAIGVEGTAHACGTLRAGSDPHHAVVNAAGKVHGMQGLYVTDGSVLPRVSRVNPALTIYAWGLRAAELLAAELLTQSTAPRLAERMTP